MRKCLITYFVALWVLLSPSSFAEWTNGQPYDNGAQLVMLQEAIVANTEAQNFTTQAVFALIGVTLVIVCAHGWRV